jgi:hypothetical protein
MSVRHRPGHHLPSVRRLLGIALASLGVVAVGCNTSPSTNQRLADAYQESGIKPVPLFPLAGKVTIDNEAPTPKAPASLLIVAYDVSKPDSRAAEHAFGGAAPDGSFEFPGGLPPGKYVMLFAELQSRHIKGFRGADGLHNLYNDPEVNANKPEFVIDHQAPGKTDYKFNLTVAGETPPAAPGPKALVSAQEAHRASARK